MPRARPRTLPAKIAVLPDVEPWARLSGERRDQHAGLVAYLSLGPGRTLQACSKVAGVPYGTLTHWSSDWLWQERVRLWAADRALVGEQGLAVRHLEVREMLADGLMPFVSKVLTYVDTIDLAGMDPRDVVAALEKLSKLVLQATGGNATGPAVALQVNTTVVSGVPSADVQLAAILRACESDPVLRDRIQDVIVGEVVA